MKVTIVLISTIDKARAVQCILFAIYKIRDIPRYTYNTLYQHSHTHIPEERVEASPSYNASRTITYALCTSSSSNAMSISHSVHDIQCSINNLLVMYKRRKKGSMCAYYLLCNFSHFWIRCYLFYPRFLYRRCKSQCKYLRVP